MSPAKDQKHSARAISTMGRKAADLSEPRIIDDPISVGLDRSIAIDTGKLVAPTNLYDADVSWVVHRRGTVSLFFAKRAIGEDQRLRTRLELRYPPENLVYHLWRNSREFHEALRKFVDLWPGEMDAQRAATDPSNWKADKDHSEWVNFESMAHAGTEATVDFYVLPPPGLARFTKGLGSSYLKIMPVVRVQTTAFELLRLLDSLEGVVLAIQGYLPTPVRQDEQKKEERS